MKLINQQLQDYMQNGFLILPNFFHESKIQLLKVWIARLVDELASYLYSQGKISETHSDKELLSRLAWIEKEFPLAAVYLHSLGEFSDELRQFILQKPMIELIESLLGSTPGLHPVWNIRAKTPQNPLATVPWHQDTAYLQTGSERIPQITTWIPLFDVALEHGPLVFIKGAHKQQTVYKHSLENLTGHPDSWYLNITEENLPQGEHTICEVPAGSLVIFNQLIPHCCLENYSEIVRWTIDLRWQNPDLANGLEGGKPCLPVNASIAQWQEWGKIKRPGQKANSYNPSIKGPWLDRWR